MRGWRCDWVIKKASQKGISGSTRPRQLQANFEPHLPLEAPWACRLRANRWIHGVSPFTPAAAISLPEASFHGDGDNQSDVWHLPGSWRRPCHAARPSRSQRCFRHCRPRDPSGSTPTLLRHLGARAQVDQVIPDRAISVRSFQRRNFGHNDGHFRHPSGIGAWPDPLHRVFCRSHWHRGAARFQRARLCRWLTGLRALEAALLATWMSTCIKSVKAWMSSNRLRLNPSKTELIWLGSSRHLHHCSSTGMRVSDVDLRPVDCVRDLGVLIDSGMMMARHVNYISGVCFFQLWQLRIIRRSLTADAAYALVRALIHTRIDYCNGLLVSCPRYLTDKLQVVLRAAARLVQLPYQSSVSEVMHRQLHWLDVVDRVNYKIGLLVYKCLHGLAPGYLSDQCIPASTFAGRANMRSSMRLDRQLYIPRTKTKTLGPQVFYYASSAMWNSLPVDLRDPGLSLHSFRTKLKSHFFKVDWFFFFFPLSIHVLYYCSFFFRRARQRDVY